MEEMLELMFQDLLHTMSCGRLSLFQPPSRRLGTLQYLWQYGTGELDTGLAVTFDLQAYGAVCFSEASAYGATAYF